MLSRLYNNLRAILHSIEYVIDKRLISYLKLDSFAFIIQGDWYIILNWI